MPATAMIPLLTGAGGAPRTFVSVGTLMGLSSGTTITAAVPGTQAAGDIGIVMFAGFASGTNVPSTPAGWTLIVDQKYSGGNHKTTLSWRRFTAAGETPPTITHNTAPANGVFACCWLFRGGIGSGTPYEGLALQQSSSTFIASPTVDPTAVGTMVVYFTTIFDDQAWGTPVPPPAGYTIAGSDQTSAVGGGGGARMLAVYKAKPADHASENVQIGSIGGAGDIYMTHGLALL